MKPSTKYLTLAVALFLLSFACGYGAGQDLWNMQPWFVSVSYVFGLASLFVGAVALKEVSDN
ncbi:MAG: hypothetical protein WAV09_00870 [Minisyncoccia bacterium]